MTRSISASAIALAFAVALCGPAYPLGLNVSLGASASSNANSSAGEASTSLAVGADIGGQSNPSDGTTAIGATSSDGAGAQAASTATTGNASGIASVVNLIATSNWTTHSLANVSAISDARNVDVSAWLDTQTSAELRQAISANASSVSNLQAAISANAAISTWLAANGAAPDQVIAAGQDVNGSLVLFTNTSAQ